MKVTEAMKAKKEAKIKRLTEIKKRFDKAKKAHQAKAVANRFDGRSLIPESVKVYLKKSKKNFVLSRRRSNVATERLIKVFGEAVHKVFMRQYRASMKFLNKKGAFEKLYAYAKKEYPDLYEKRKRKATAKDKRLINKYFVGWADDVKPKQMEVVINHYAPKAADIGGTKALEELGFKVGFHLKNPEMLKAIKERGIKITGGINKKTLKDFRRVFRKGYMEEGISPYDLRKRIKDMFEKTYKGRAFSIARTETAVAQSGTQFEAYKRNGVEKKRWLSLIDKVTRESHVFVDGQVAKINEAFDVMGTAMMHPHDGAAPADETIKCRCDHSAWVVSPVKKVWTGA